MTRHDNYAPVTIAPALISPEDRVSLMVLSDWVCGSGQGIRIKISVIRVSVGVTVYVRFNIHISCRSICHGTLLSNPLYIFNLSVISVDVPPKLHEICQNYPNIH